MYRVRPAQLLEVVVLPIDDNVLAVQIDGIRQQRERENRRHGGRRRGGYLRSSHFRRRTPWAAAVEGPVERRDSEDSLSGK